MVRGNCDYIFLQPIYNKTQRDVIWDLEAAFMDKNDFSVLMDQVIVRKNLEGNSAQTPKKTVQIMVGNNFCLCCYTSACALRYGKYSDLCVLLRKWDCDFARLGTSRICSLREAPYATIATPRAV